MATFSETALDDVIAFGRSQGYTPADIAIGVRQWQGGVLDEQHNTATPEDFARGQADIDAQVKEAQQGLMQDHFRSQAESLIPDENERIGWAERYTAKQKGIADDSELGWSEDDQAKADAIHSSFQTPAWRGRQNLPSRTLNIGGKDVGTVNFDLGGKGESTIASISGGGKRGDDGDWINGTTKHVRLDTPTQRELDDEIKAESERIKQAQIDSSNLPRPSVWDEPSDRVAMDQMRSDYATKVRDAESRIEALKRGGIPALIQDRLTKRLQEEDVADAQLGLERGFIAQSKAFLTAIPEGGASGSVKLAGGVGDLWSIPFGDNALAKWKKEKLGALEATSDVNPLQRDQFSTKAAQAAGAMVPVLAASAVTGGGARLVGLSEAAVARASLYGSQAAMASTGAAGGADEADNYQMEGWKRNAMIAGYAAIQPISERLGGNFESDFVRRTLLGQSVKAQAGNLAMRMGKQGLLEGVVEEAPAGFASDSLAQAIGPGPGYTGPMPNPFDMSKRGEEAALGFVLGAGMGGIMPNRGPNTNTPPPPPAVDPDGEPVDPYAAPSSDEVIDEINASLAPPPTPTPSPTARQPILGNVPDAPQVQPFIPGDMESGLTDIGTAEGDAFGNVQQVPTPQAPTIEGEPIIEQAAEATPSIRAKVAEAAAGGANPEMAAMFPQTEAPAEINHALAKAKSELATLTAEFNKPKTNKGVKKTLIARAEQARRAIMEAGGTSADIHEATYGTKPEPAPQAVATTAQVAQKAAETAGVEPKADTPPQAEAKVEPPALVKEETTPDVVKEKKPADPKAATAQKKFLVTSVNDAIKESPQSLSTEQRAIVASMQIPAPKQGSASDGQYQDIFSAWKASHDASMELAASRIGYVTMDVPGDGTFNILNTREALAKFARQAAKFPVSTPKASAPPARSTNPSSIAPVTSKPTSADIIKAAHGLTGEETPGRAHHLVLSDGENIVATDGRVLIRFTRSHSGTEENPVFFDQNGNPAKTKDRFGSWKQVMPDMSKMTKVFSKIDTGRLIRIIRQAKAILKDGKGSINLHLNADKSLGVSAIGEGLDGYEHNVQEGSQNLIALNPDYLDSLLTAARRAGYNTVDIHGMDNHAPIVIAAPDMTGVLMPMKGVSGFQDWGAAKKTLSAPAPLQSPAKASPLDSIPRGKTGATLPQIMGRAGEKGHSSADTRAAVKAGLADGSLIGEGPVNNGFPKTIRHAEAQPQQAKQAQPNHIADASKMVRASIARLNSQQSTPGMVPVAAIARDSGLPLDQVQDALKAMHDEGEGFLSPHDRPADMTAEEKAAVVPGVVGGGSYFTPFALTEPHASPATLKANQKTNDAKLNQYGLDPAKYNSEQHGSKSLPKAFALMAKDKALNQVQRWMARLLSKMDFTGVQLRIVANGNLDFAGSYQEHGGRNGKGTIHINTRAIATGNTNAEQNIAETLIHEALHHITSRFVDGVAKMSPAQKLAIANLEKLLPSLRAKLSAIHGGKFTYQLSNLHEFISALFTQAEFQQALADADTNGLPKTLVQQSKDMLSEIFRRIASLFTGNPIADGSVAHVAFDNALRLVQDPAKTELDMSKQGLPGSYFSPAQPQTMQDRINEAASVVNVPRTSKDSQARELKDEFSAGVTTQQYDSVGNDPRVTEANKFLDKLDSLPLAAATLESPEAMWKAGLDVGMWQAIAKQALVRAVQAVDAATTIPARVAAQKIHERLVVAWSVMGTATAQEMQARQAGDDIFKAHQAVSEAIKTQQTTTIDPVIPVEATVAAATEAAAQAGAEASTDLAEAMDEEADEVDAEPEPTPASPTVSERIKSKRSKTLDAVAAKLAAQREAALARLRASMGQVGAFNLSQSPDAIIAGASFLAEKALNLANFTQAFARVGVEASAEEMQRLLDASQAYLDEQNAAAKAKRKATRKPAKAGTEKKVEEAQEEVNKATKTADSILTKIAETHADPPIWRGKAKGDENPIRKLYREHLENPMPQAMFEQGLTDLEVDGAMAITLAEAANLEIAARARHELAKQEMRLARDVELAEAQAGRVLYKAGLQHRQAGYQIGKGPEADSIRKVFTEHVNKPMSLAQFFERLQALNVKSPEVISRMWRVAERERAALDEIAKRKQVLRAEKREERRAEMADKTAGKLIFEVSKLHRQAGFGVLEGKNKDSIRAIFREHVNKVLPFDKFSQRLKALGVSDEVIDRLDTVANRERAALDEQAAQKQARSILKQDSPALAKLLAQLRPKIAPGMTWKDIFTSTATDQATWERETYTAMAKEPALANLTPEERRQLFREVSKAWQKQRKKVMAKVMMPLIDKLDGVKSHAKPKVRAATPRLLGLINLGGLDSQTFRDAISKEFGIGDMNDAEAKRLRKLAADIQEAPEGLPAKLLTDQFLRGMQKLTNMTRLELLNSYWVAAVLSGHATMTDIGLSLGNGVQDVFFGSLSTAFKTGNKWAAIKAWSEFVKAIPIATLQAGHHLATGNTALMRNSKETEKGWMEGKGKSFGNAGRQMMRERSAYNPLYIAGGGMELIGRLLTAFDHVNSSSTYEGMKMLSMAYHPEEWAKAMAVSPADKATAKQRARNELFGGRPPKGLEEFILEKSRVKEILNQVFPAEILVEANELGRDSALQGDPTGVGAWIKDILTAITSKPAQWAESFDEFKEEGNSNALGRAIRAAAAGGLNGVSTLSRTLFGNVFINTGANFINRQIGHLPGIGLFKIPLDSKYRGKQWGAKHDVLIGQQIFSTLATFALLKLLTGDEGDDEEGKKPKPFTMGIEGGWHDVPGDKRSQLYVAKKKPYTVWYVDGQGVRHTYNYMQWGVSAPFAFIGSVRDNQRYLPGDKSDMAIILSGMFNGATSSLDKAQLKGLADVFGRDSSYSTDSAEGFVNRLNKWGSNLVGGLIPRGIKDVDAIASPELRETKDLWSYWTAQVPMARESMNEKRIDIFGEDIILDRSLGWRVAASAKLDPERRTLGELNSRDLWLPDPGNGKRKVKTDGEPRDMTDQERRRYLTEAGKMYRLYIRDNGRDLLAMEKKDAAKQISDDTNIIRARAAARATIK